jgi:hypothetical protein
MCPIGAGSCATGQRLFWHDDFHVGNIQKDIGHEEGSRQATLRTELIRSATKLSGALQNRAVCCDTYRVVAFFQ